jgi:hypothetical protein
MLIDPIDIIVITRPVRQFAAKGTGKEKRKGKEGMDEYKFECINDWFQFRCIMNKVIMHIHQMIVI